MTLARPLDWVAPWVGFWVCLAVATAAACGHEDMTPSPATAADVAAYTAEQLACVDAEPTDACRADKVACKVRIDACRSEVRRRFGR